MLNSEESWNQAMNTNHRNSIPPLQSVVVIGYSALSSHRDRIGGRDTKSLCRGATAQAAESHPGEAETRRLAANKLPKELTAIPDKLFVFMSSAPRNGRWAFETAADQRLAVLRGNQAGREGEQGGSHDVFASEAEHGIRLSLSLFSCVCSSPSLSGGIQP